MKTKSRISNTVMTLTLKKVFKRIRLRSGMTLVEMGFAISIAAVWSIMTLGTVAAGIDLRRRAEKMSLASSLAQSKLAQLLSQPFLTPTDSNGQIEQSGPYANFEFNLKVTEEQIDLTSVANEGIPESIKIDDQFGASIQNSVPREKAGQSSSTETGGLIDINRIVLTIRYPIKAGEKADFRIETFKAAVKSAKP